MGIIHYRNARRGGDTIAGSKKNKKRIILLCTPPIIRSFLMPVTFVRESKKKKRNLGFPLLFIHLFYIQLPMAENTETRPETPRPGTLEQIALQIKSLEQRTTSVTLPRNASVLQLKHEIQVAFDVDSNRQRLIFQGRVLKDDKNLTDYGKPVNRCVS